MSAFKSYRPGKNTSGAMQTEFLGNVHVMSIAGFDNQTSVTFTELSSDSLNGNEYNFYVRNKCL